MNKKVAFHTLGCKLNFSETSTIAGQFSGKGFQIVEFGNFADVYVFNTCTVTQAAERECRQLVRRALKVNPEAFIIVTGCYAQLRPEEISSISGVDVVMGSNEKFKLFSLIDSFEKRESSCIYVSEIDNNEFGSAASTDSDSRTRAFLKVQDGCDYKCSFCTIPMARGKSRSMSPEAAVRDLEKLVSDGYKEIILTGVNVGDYGLNYETDFFELLKKLVNVEGEFRLRISSIEPNLLTDDILALVKDNPKLCNHFHIPLQSGSDKILKLMQRRYKTIDYAKLIEKVNTRLSNTGIGVDVITGFPGETDEDFNDTYKFINELEVSYLHTFTYSERPDTKAVTMPGKVDVHVRKTRNNMLRILSEKKRFNFYKSNLGSIQEVLFEEHETHGMMKGFTSNYIRTAALFTPELTNKITKVELTDIENNICRVKII